MDSLYLSGLGSPQILLDNQRVEIKRRKAVALLFYLALEKQPQSREFLSGLFWPEYGQSKAFAYLRRTLWEIKNTLGEGYLEINQEWVGISTTANFQLDINEFHSSLQSINEHDHPFSEPCDRCLGVLINAVNLYRGDFLLGFSLRDCSRFDDWQFFNTEINRRKFVEALKILVNELEQRDKIGESITYAQRWLATDRLDETVHRKLMALYAKSGQHHAALRQFEVCQNTLQKELNLVPEEETVQLRNRILEYRSTSTSIDEKQAGVVITEGRHSSWLEQVLSDPVQIAAQSNLPVQTTPFIGRQSERMEIATLLQNQDCWLLTLVGMGGVGKTRLAIQVGHELISMFPHGVFFVSLESLKSISGLVPLLSEALGLPLHHQSGQLHEQLLSFLSTKQLLVILDNFDTFTADAAIVTQLHAEAPGLKFLVTSRSQLQITGEWVFDIQGLVFPESNPQKIEESLHYDAVELFVRTAVRNQKDFQVNKGNYGNILDITRFVGGLPLGLVMAASWLNVFSPKEIAVEIQRNFDFLATELQDIPIRQKSMRAVLAYSWDRLNPDERRALADLSIFRGGFSREAAIKVGKLSHSDIRKFMVQAFLHRRGDDRFHFHELMRQYALEQLHESSDAYQSQKDRHATYYCAALNRWGEGMKGPEQIDILPVMRVEMDNILTAWAWVTQHKQITQIDKALEGLCYFFLRNYRNREGLEVCQPGLDALTGAQSESEQLIRAKVLVWAGIFSLNLDDHQKAGDYLDFASSLLNGLEGKGLDIDSLQAQLLFSMAIIENYRGNRANAIKLYDRVESIYRRLGDVSTFSCVMLRAIDTGGVTSESIFQFLSYVIKRKRKVGDLFNTAYILYIYCMIVAYHFGDASRAEALSRESCAIFEKLGDPLCKEMTLTATDPILGINGRYEELLIVREKKLAYARERGDHQIAGIYLSEVGETLGHLGDYPTAEARYREALTYLEKGTDYQYALRLCGLGEVLLVQGKAEEAYAIFKQSVLGMRIGEPWGLGKTLAGLSVATSMRGDPETAWITILQALEKHLEMHTFYFAHYSLAAYAFLLSQRGDVLSGIEIYTLLARQKFVHNSCWFDDLYCKEVYACGNVLHAEDISAAEARGKDLDLWETVDRLIREGLEPST